MTSSKIMIVSRLLSSNKPVRYSGQVDSVEQFLLKLMKQDYCISDVGEKQLSMSVKLSKLP